MYCKMITMISQLTSIAIHSSKKIIFLVMRTFNMHSPIYVQIRNTVSLPIVTMLYISSPRIIHFITGNFLFSATSYLFFKIYLFIYFWLRWVFVAAGGLSLVVVSGGYSSCWCAGFLLWWLLLLRSTGSRQVGFCSCGTRALERRLSSCGTRA